MIKKLLSMFLLFYFSNINSSIITFKGRIYEFNIKENICNIYAFNEKDLEYIKKCIEQKNCFSEIKKIVITSEIIDSFCREYEKIDKKLRWVFAKEQIKEALIVESDIIRIAEILLDCVKNVYEENFNCIKELFSKEFFKSVGKASKREFINERKFILYNQILPLYLSASQLYRDLKNITINETNYQIVKNKILDILPLLNSLSILLQYPSKKNENLIRLVEEEKYEEYFEELWKGINSNNIWIKFWEEVNKNSKNIKNKYETSINKNYKINYEIKKKEEIKLKNLPY